MLCCGDNPIGNTLTERDSADELLPEASTSPQFPECPSNSDPEGTQQSERLLAQSTFTGVEEEGLSGTGMIPRLLTVGYGSCQETLNIPCLWTVLTLPWDFNR
jgi:hypothetical protein